MKTNVKVRIAKVYCKSIKHLHKSFILSMSPFLVQNKITREELRTILTPVNFDRIQQIFWI